MTEQEVKAIQDDLASTKAELEDMKLEVWTEYSVKKLTNLAKERDLAIARYEHAAGTLRHILHISKQEESVWRQFLGWWRGYFGK